MILYFSATGNCKFIAEQIAAQTGEQSASVVDCIRAQRYDFSGETLFGLVTPTYFWRLPRIVADALAKLRLPDGGYTFFLASYGTTTGQAAAMARALTARRGRSFDAYYSVIMPDTWTPIFDLSDAARVDRRLRTGKQQLAAVIARIRACEHGNFVDKWLPRWVAAVPSAYMYAAERKTRRLSVNTDRCIGCGLCAKKCPVGAICMEDGHPVWTADTCEMCLGCLHRCPKHAIRYGSGKTDVHGQYRNPDTRI